MTTTTLQDSSQRQLRQIIEQIERLEEEKKATAGDITDKYAEAKALGFDPKIMKQVIALRRKSSSERQEQGALLDTYLHALGMLDVGGTPMGDWLDRKPAISDGAKALEILLGAETKGASHVEYGGGVWSVRMFREVLTEMGIAGAGETLQ